MFRNHIIIKIVTGCVLAAGIYAAFLGIRSLDYFTVSEVHFSGTSYVSKKLLAKSVGVELNKNIFDIDLRAVEDRLMKNPWFDAVDVSRKLPGTVSVLVRERKPSFVLVSGTSYHLVAGDGVVLAPVSRLAEGNYLLFSGMGRSDSTPGRKLFKKYPELRTIVYTLARKNLIIKCREIRLTESEGWILLFGESAYPVLLGKLNTQVSLDKFFRAKQKAEQENVALTSIDCRFKNMAVIVAQNKSL